MSAGKRILLGCGIVVAAGAVVLGLVIAWMVYVSEDIDGASVSIRSPLDVRVGETFTLEVDVKNERPEDVLTVADIDISASYLDGFAVVSTAPAYKSGTHVPFLDTVSHTFDTRIDAGATATFAFTLRAEHAGIFRGDIDVYEGSRLTTTIAQTVVKD